MKNLLITLGCCLAAHLSFSQSTDSSRFYFNNGIEENNARLYAVAAKDFDKAIKLNPNFIEAYIANGKANLEMRRIFDAVNNFSRAYELDPKNNEVIKELTSLYFNNRQFQKAIEFAEK